MDTFSGLLFTFNFLNIELAFLYEDPAKKGLLLKALTPIGRGKNKNGSVASPEIISFHTGVGRFRILGGQALEYWGGAKGGPNSQQAHDVVMTSTRRNDVASTSFRRHVPPRFLINQCQIITFLIKI